MTPSLKKAIHKGLSQTGHFKHHSTHKAHEIPKFANSLFGSYQGAYSKSYAPSFDGTFRSRSTAAGTLYSTITVTREADNQQGKDAVYEEVRPEIHHPVEFGKQRARDVFHKRDGAMRVNAHENRFIQINDTTLVNSKFKKYQSPGFENWAEHSLDEYICNPTNCRNENVNHIYHDTNRKLVEVDLAAGVPTFDRYITRQENPEKTQVLGMQAAPVPYDKDKVTHGYHMTRKQDCDAVPFKLLQGRDNLYQRMHGLPKHTKEEMV